MTHLAPLVVAVPLVAAALLGALAPFLRVRRLLDITAIAVIVCVLGMCVALLVGSGSGVVVHWFGGWTPRHGVAVGIDFAVDPLGAGVAALTAALMTAALVFSWRYFDAIGTLFHCLMLVFAAAMCAFALTGDLFDMFVFFELMGVSAYALTAYRVEDPGPIVGAINFAVSNSCGAFFLLTGIGLLYGRTGALNLEQIGQALSGHPRDALVVVALVLIVVGFLVKASIVPFHFWLADAHAVAPTPVCVLFSGVMVELGIYAIARVAWTVFVPAFGIGHLDALRGVLLVLATLTALVGGAMCLVQRHVKRLLAFSTIAHSGVMLGAVAAFTPLGLAAAGVYLLGHGLVKASLFLGIGTLLHRTRFLDEGRLRGKGVGLRRGAVLMGLGGLALAGMPPFALALGKGLIDDATRDAGAAWFVAVSVAVSVLTGGAVLRMVLRVFTGAGEPMPRQNEFAEEVMEHEEETPKARERTPAVMWVPIAVLLAAAVAVGVVPGVARGAVAAAARLTQTTAYAHSVLDGAPASALGLLPSTSWTATTVVTGLVSAALAVLLATFALRRGVVRDACGTFLLHAMRPLRALHSGHPGDYIAWLSTGAATLAVVAVLILRSG